MYRNIKIIMVLTMTAILFTGCGKADDRAPEVVTTPVGVEDETEEKEEFVDNNQAAINEEDDGLSDVAVEKEASGLTKEDLYGKLVSGGKGKLPVVKGDNATIAELKKQIAGTTKETEKAKADKAKADKAKADKANETTKKKTTTNKKSQDTVSDNNKAPTVKATPKRTDRAAVKFDGTEIVTAIKINSTKRGSKAIAVLENAEDENGASFGTVANKGYEIVVVNFKITLPSNIASYNEECIPEIRVRGTDGKLLNGEAVYIYTGELKNYKNDGRVKTYDIVFEIPKKVSKYSIQFGISGADNYIWYSK